MNIEAIKNKLSPIKTEEQYNYYLGIIDQLIDCGEDSKEEDLLELISILVMDYETKHYPIGEPDPIEYIKFRMEQLSLTQKDVAKWFGGANRVSEVLNRKRGLTLKMIRTLHHELKIPAEALLAL